MSELCLSTLGFCLLVAPSAPASVLWKAGNDNNLALVTSWWTTEAGSVNPGSIGTTDTLRFGGSGQGASRTLALGSDLSVGALRLDNQTGTPNYNVVISAGNTLTLNGNTDYVAAPVQGIVLNSSAGGTLTVNANIVVGSSQRWVSSRNLNIGGNVDLGANTLMFYSAGGATTVSGAIGGLGGIGRTNSSAGAVILTGTNTFTGDIRNELGTLQIGGSGSLGSGSYAGAIVNKGTLAYASSANQTLSGLISGSGGLNKSGASTLALAAANTYSGDTIISNGILRLDNASALQNSRVFVQVANGLDVNGYNANTKGVGGSGSLNLGSTLFTATTDANITYSGALSGSGTFAKEGTAQQILTGTSSFSGTFRIGNGLLVVDTTAPITGTPNVEINSTDAADGLVIGDVYAHGTMEIGNLSGTGGKIRVDWDTPSGPRTLKVNQSVDAAFAGVMENAATGNRFLALTKAGDARLTLTGANTYSGNTAIAAGTLALGASGSINNTRVIDISAGAELDVSAKSGFHVVSGQKVTGKGSVTGATIFDGGSTLSPGNSAGVLTFNNDLSLAASATYVVEIDWNGSGTPVGGVYYPAAGTANDQALMNGGTFTVDSSAILNVSLLQSYGPLSNLAAFRIVAGSHSGTFGVSSVSSGGHTYSLYYGNYNGQGDGVWLTEVPEPGTLGLLGLAAALAVRRRKAAAP